MHVVRTVNGMTRSARKLLGTDGSLYTYTGPLGPLLFLLYINDLPKIIPKYNNIVLFADDTSILITDSNNIDFNINIHQSLTSLITWFNTNLLTLNLNKPHYIEFKKKKLLSGTNKSSVRTQRYI